MHVDDFTDYTSWGNDIGRSGLGKPATGTWRSNDTADTIPIQVLRVAPDIFETMRQTPRIAAWLDAAAPENFIAWLDKCTHFCCVPGFKATAQSVAFGAADKVYCPCHQSVYDPFSISEESFVALPRPVDS